MRNETNPPDPPAASPAPKDVRNVSVHDEIAREARCLWERYGKPAGRDEMIWLEAERQVLGVDPRVRQERAASVRAGSFARLKTGALD